MTVYDDSDPIMAGLQQLERDGYATDAQRAVAGLALAEIERLREASEIVAYALLYQLVTNTNQVRALRDQEAMSVRGEEIMPPGRQGQTLQAALDTILGEGQVTIDKRGDED